MQTTTPIERAELLRLDPEQLRNRQLAQFNHLLEGILGENRFYREKFSALSRPITGWEQFEQLPLTSKREIVSTDPNDRRARNHTWPFAEYLRYHQTSGTAGHPMVVLDTAADWQAWIDSWQYVLDVVEVTPHDRAFLAFSFGPFIGFWSAHDAVAARGTTVIPGGGMRTTARLQMIRDSRATLLFCTPTYALHMAEVAEEDGFDLASLDVRCIIVAGEPGGSVPAVRSAIESKWNADLLDHSGATEIGAWGFGNREGTGLYLNEANFIAETISLDSGTAAGEGELAELVLTNLYRQGCPAIRYRTGDLVKATRQASGDCRFLFLPGGILGRIDDMMIIRGVNIFPSSVEQVLREFPEVSEFRLTAHKRNAMDQLTVEVEDRAQDAGRIARLLETRLGISIEVQCVDLGSLPRFEAKGKRFIDRRNE